MSKLICLQHPKYTGKDSPVLSCKTCCGIFIGQIKEENNKGENATAPSKDMTKEQRRRNVVKRRAEASNASGKGRIGFNPDLI